MTYRSPRLAAFIDAVRRHPRTDRNPASKAKVDPVAYAAVLEVLG
jgi:hypothetical protein